MTKKFASLLFIGVLLLGTGCDSMLQDHPIDTNKSTLELSIVLGYLDYLNQPLTTVSGKVTLCTLNGSGNPNVKVTLRGKYENHETYTDSSGNFLFNNVRSSDYILAVLKQGHHFQPETQTLSVGANGASNIDIETLVTWEKTIGGEGWEKAYSIKQTNDCGYVTAGYKTLNESGDLDVYVLKLDINGNTAWEHSMGSGNSDIAYDIQNTSDGGFILTGITYSSASALGDYLIFKLDSNGNEEWNKIYGGSERDEARSIKQTGNGYVVTGFSESYTDDVCDIRTLLLDNNGDIIQALNFDYNITDKSYAVEITSDGGYVIAGSTETTSGDYDLMVFKVNSTGTVLWSYISNKDKYDEAYDVEETSDGGLIVCGSSGLNSGDFWILKLTASGGLDWEQNHGDADVDKAYSIKQTQDGGYIVCGYTYSLENVNNDMKLLKLDSLGNIEWAKTFNGKDDDNDVARSVIQTSDGGYAITGYTSTYTNRDDIWIKKLNSTGEIIP